MMGFDEMIHELFENHQGWFLTGLSSLMCILGALIIYSDLFVKFFNPNSTFDIKSNEKFLICGFSLSSGSLLFTSLFKLLPKGLEYFDGAVDSGDDQNDDSHESLIRPSLSMMIYFFIGIVACELLNYAIHHFTSESIVHCNHGGEDHDESHDDLENQHSHSHTHSHSHSTSSEEVEAKSTHSHGHTHHIYHGHSNEHADEESLISNDIPHYGSSHDTDPLVVQHETTIIQPTHGSSDEPRPAVVAQRKSFFDLAMNKLRQRGSAQCIGIEDQDCEGVSNCINEELTSNVANDLHNLNFYRGLAVSKSKNSLVAYTTITSPQQQQDLVPIHPSNIRLTNEPNLDLHQQHKDDHHHQINTPISKLLSIGLQTCLALTLHKFPEGFITYATSAADPTLGVSIFLSLAIHNIVEGFSMTLPLYLALNSRAKAFGITFILGGLSQPIGALLAYYLIAGREIDQSESYYIFGILMSITSGFLSVISLQLFASSINFGGSANRVITWCLIGIFIIQVSNVLTDYNY